MEKNFSIRLKMNKKTSMKQLREFGIIFGLGFPLFIGFLIPKILGHDFRLWTIYIGLPVLVIGILKPKKLKSFYKIWILLGNILGWINSRIILSLVYLLVLIPISIFMRICGYDPLRIKTNLRDKSYRLEKEPNHDIVFKRIF